VAIQFVVNCAKKKTGVSLRTNGENAIINGRSVTVVIVGRISHIRQTEGSGAKNAGSHI
jgi:hypothetical protein